jgi:ketosteroid isomerase-like protein
MTTPVQWHAAEFVGIPLAPGGEVVADKLQLAREVMEGFACRDIDRLISLSAPDAEFRTRVDVTGEPEFRGQEGVRAWLGAVDEKYDLYEITDAEYRAGEGDAVVVSCYIRLRFAGDRYGMARTAYWVFRIDEERGLVTAFTSFRDLDDALAAAGISGGA